MCSSYTALTDDSCYGYYCGVSEEMLAAELSASRKCQLPADLLCAGTLSQKVAACARQVISNPLNIGNSDDQIRSKIQDCVYGEQALKDVTSEECLSCYLDGAMCAKANCTGPCLGGDSASCDACREDNNCNQPVAGCAGLPTPF